MKKIIIIIGGVIVVWVLYFAITTSDSFITPTPTPTEKLCPDGSRVFNKDCPLPTPTPKVSITNWATLEYQWFINANKNNWTSFWGKNEVGETRWYRKENNVWVRKNTQAEAETPFYIPTPTPLPTPEATPRPCPPNSYRTGTSCTCLSNYVVNDTKTSCIVNPQIEEINNLLAEWQKQQEELAKQLEQYKEEEYSQNSNLDSIRQQLITEIQKIRSNPNLSKSLAETRIAYLGNPQSPTGSALLSAGITAVCGDLWFSKAYNPQGDCSYHGGVWIWVR